MSKKRTPAPQSEGVPPNETVLYRAVAGPQSSESLVLANYYPLPFEPEEINSCIIEVKSFPDRTEWAPILQLPLWIQSITRLSSGGFLLSSDDGTLIRVINDAIEEIPLSLPPAVLAIWERASDDYWIFHSEGLVHWDGRTTLSGAIKTDGIFNMHALGCDFAIAVGQAGMVLSFDGRRWSEVESVPTNKPLNGVVCVAPNEIYISGWQGVLYRWDGNAQWQKIKYVGDLDSSEIYGGDLSCYRGTVYKCAGGFGLFKIAGKKAEAIETFYSTRAMVINDKLIVTGENMWNEYDGNEWIQVEMSL